MKGSLGYSLKRPTFSTTVDIRYSRLWAYCAEIRSRLKRKEDWCAGLRGMGTGEEVVAELCPERQSRNVRSWGFRGVWMGSPGGKEEIGDDGEVAAQAV